MINRRDIVAMLRGTAVARPRRVHAQRPARMPTRQLVRLFLLLVVISQLNGTRAAADEGIDNLAFPRGLTKIIAPPAMQISGKQVVALVLKPDETVDGWTEISGAGTFLRAASMNDVMGATPFVTAYDSCNGAEKSLTIKAESPDRMTYEAHVQNCTVGEDYVQLGLIVRGKASQWHIFYGAKAKQLTAERRAEVLDNFARARYRQ